MDKHLAIYNISTREVEYEESYPIDAREDVKNLKHGYDDEGKPTEKEEKIGEIVLWEHRRKVLWSECGLRGLLNGAWKVYTEDEPFDWNNLVGDRVLSSTQKAAYDTAVEEAAKK